MLLKILSEEEKGCKCYLTKIHFFKVIKLTNVFMYNYNLKILRVKDQETNFSSFNKWQVSKKLLSVTFLV